MAQLPAPGPIDSITELYGMNESQIRDSQTFQSICSINDTDRAQLLASILPTPEPSYKPLSLLNLLLEEKPDCWPVFDLLRCHTRLTNALPEAARRAAESANLINSTLEQVKKSYGSLTEFLHSSENPALRFNNQLISHQSLHQFIHNFRLPTHATSSRKPVVGIALPNGPLLAATCLAVVTYYTAAPINPAAGPEQFQADVLQAGATVILTTHADAEKLQLGEAWVIDAGIQILIVDLDSNMKINIQNRNGTGLSQDIAHPLPNTADDIGIILFTSGTSGTKKTVPLMIHSIVTGVAQVIDSWALTENDICLNMMPLYHVGGLVRNIFAPIFSGGSTVCCPAFDPNLFWDIAEEIQPTWYYASPSMHSVILDEATRRQDAVAKSRIRLVCNAAGGLLPSLAYQLRDTFKSVVLPSYGMTECMPISTPPINYRLDRPGTSGISTGAELSILDWEDVLVPSGEIGRICIRGEPVFKGYLKPDGQLDKSVFNKDGWFDSGDLGYMDNDGYLYITGRSKEVINRGGEIISPFEVENAIIAAAKNPDSPVYGRISQTLAFSIQHDILQEVVGIVIVTPPHQPRPELKQIHEAVRFSLQQVKWPVLVTYMNDLPKRNNKILRIKLSDRLSLPEVTDSTQYLMRHWEATCPPPDTELSVKIAASPCQVDVSFVTSTINSLVPEGVVAYVRKNPLGGTLEAYLAPEQASCPPLDPELVDAIRNEMTKSLHSYWIPQEIYYLDQPLSLTIDGGVDEDAFESLLSKTLDVTCHVASDSIEMKLIKIFADTISCSPARIRPEVDFFTLGGDSLRAGRLISAVRSEFKVHLPFDIVFTGGSVKALSAYIDKHLPEASTTSVVENQSLPGCEKVYSSTNPILLILQLVPAVLLYPMRRAFTWVAFFYFLVFTESWRTSDPIPGRLFNLVFSIFCAKIATRLVFPWVGIVAKWVIIGRYKEGVYPMWGLYHTRWWMAQKIIDICGLGFFKLSQGSLLWYYRFMGASIGKNVTLKGATLGEWDLLDIRDGAILENCICRPFAGERNTSMYLGRIVIGSNAAVGRSSIVAPGTTVPDNTCIGPNSSSWEIQDADEANRDYLRSKIPSSHWALKIFFTLPLTLLAWIFHVIPWLCGLLGLVTQGVLSDDNPLLTTLHWFAGAERVKWHYFARALRSFFGPFFLFAFAVLIKGILDILFGKLGGSRAEDRGNIERWRKELMKAILPASSLHSLTEMFGQHYEFTSIAIRTLGGRIGKRVYWPGTGPSISDYHLIDIGDDVVFGSRAHLVTSDGIGSEPLSIGAKAMIADRVTLLPGTKIGEETVMGSGALGARGKSYNAYATYVGSKGGDSVCLISGREERNLKAKAKTFSSSDEISLANSLLLHAEKKVTVIEKNISASSSTTILSTPRQTQTDITAFSSAITLSAIEKGPLERVDSHTSSETGVVSARREQDLNKTSPFGRAFYYKEAPYHVLNQFTIFCYSSFIIVFVALYWDVPSISSIQLVSKLSEYDTDLLSNKIWWQPFLLYALFTGLISVLTTLQSLLALAIVISAKWILIGRRQPGNYDWDTSSYCQRWQAFLSIEKIRRNCYRGHGILGMLTGTWYVTQYFRALGAKIGPNCALFAGGRPSLTFTEPDLLTLGERVVVDDASLVGHINTRGKFDLNRLSVGDRCVLRSGSRLLSGAEMKNDSCLMEHTLIMGGDIVDARSTMQGWPADRFSGNRLGGSRMG